nr:DNA mismatch repair protein Mlh1 [Hymenolepis microstoma]
MNPPRIKALPAEVVNKIAAGEVIQRPCNAVKELIENSLDAGSTMIQISLRGGGMKLIQVQDDGNGIDPADFPILCQRFTTSKLEDFQGLSQLQTFGFRGEALASLSYVTSRLTVTSRPPGHNCAYRAEYSGGVLICSSEGSPSAPQRCAGNPGTCVQAEDLFHNLPSRRDALRSARDEFIRIADVVARYSLHYAGKCGFFLRSLDRKVGPGASPMSIGGDMRTTKEWNKEQVIKAVFGDKMVGDLISLSSAEQTFDADSVKLAVDKLGLKFEGLFSNPSKITSEGTPSVQLVLFVNNRLVESLNIKRAVESAYATLLPHRVAKLYSSSANPSGNSSLFGYLKLEMPTTSLDVNVHPTKAQIHFLNEDEIIAGVRDAIEQTLTTSTGARNILFQSLNLKSSQENRQAPVSSVQPSSHPPFTPVTRSSNSPRPVVSNSSPSTYRPERLVRTDARVQRLDAFMNPFPSSSSCLSADAKSPVDPSPEISGSESEDEEFRIKLTASNTTEIPRWLNSSSSASKEELKLQKSAHRRQVLLESVQTMREAVEARASADARDLLRDCVFVGCISRSNCLVQHTTNLLLLRLHPLAKELFYQLAVANFANHGEMTLSSPAPVSALLSCELTRCLPEASASEVAVIVDKGCSILIKRSAMLWDYFSLRVEVDANGVLQLYSLPLLLDRFVPDMRYLPKLLTRMVREVNWNEEGACFSAICQILASFYAKCVDDDIEVKPLGEKADALNLSELAEQSRLCNEAEGGKENQQEECQDSNPWSWTVEHVLLPAIRTILLPSHTMCFPTTEEKSPAVLKLTSLPDLYKVFERC